MLEISQENIYLMATPIAQNLKERIIFKNVTAPFNAATRVGSNPVTVTTARASVEELGGEFAVPHQKSITQIVEYEIWTQYQSAITGFQQIAWGDKMLVQIVPPQKIVDARGRAWLCIRAKETIGTIL